MRKKGVFGGLPLKSRDITSARWRAVANRTGKIVFIKVVGKLEPASKAEASGVVSQFRKFHGEQPDRKRIIRRRRVNVISLKVVLIAPG